MKKLLIALLSALTLLFCACGGSSGAGTVTVWRAVSPYYRTGGELLRPEVLPVSPGVGLINSAIACFNSEPSDAEMTLPLPSGIRILGYETRGGELRLELPASFGELDAARVTLARAAMALTFCSLEGVTSVSVWCENEELFPPLAPDDLVLQDELT